MNHRTVRGGHRGRPGAGDLAVSIVDRSANVDDGLLGGRSSDLPVDSGASDGEQLSEFSDRVLADTVELEQDSPLGRAELGRLALEPAFGAGDGHPFGSPHAQRVDLELSLGVWRAAQSFFRSRVLALPTESFSLMTR